MQNEKPNSFTTWEVFPEAFPSKILPIRQNRKTEDRHNFLCSAGLGVPIRGLEKIQGPSAAVPLSWCSWLAPSLDILQWIRAVSEDTNRCCSMSCSHGKVHRSDKGSVERDGFQQLPLVEQESRPKEERWHVWGRCYNTSSQQGGCIDIVTMENFKLICEEFLDANSIKVLIFSSPIYYHPPPFYSMRLWLEVWKKRSLTYIFLNEYGVLNFPSNLPPPMTTYPITYWYSSSKITNIVTWLTIWSF